MSFSRKISKLFLCLTTVILLLPAPNQAGTITEKAAEAERLLNKGDPGGALDLLNEAIGFIWEEMPLTVHNVTFIDSVESYGVFVERENDATFKPGESLKIYAEPEGFGYERKSETVSLIKFLFLVGIKDSDGRLLYPWYTRSFPPITVHHGVRTAFIVINVNVPKMEPGSYIASIRLRDRVSDKFTSFELPFTVVDR